ncbi:MAG: class I SAM-dependent rRNA methyltransferase [Bryobacteraceae bacterium]
MAAVKVNRKAAERLASGHPWIFASDVVDRGEAQPGDAVQVVDPRGRPLGIAHYSSTSQITLRLLSDRVEPFDAAFLYKRLGKALTFREQFVRNSTAYRLVHGEADLLPGLVVDRYGEYLVIQTLSQGMDRAKPEILTALQELLKPAGIVARNDVAVRKHEALPLETAVVQGTVPEHVQIDMNGFVWEANLMEGQKTGVFLDQRENYAAAAGYASGRALDCFTCTGGFAIHMAGRCESVEAVDSSATALATAQRNAALNRIGNVSFRNADVFNLLSSYSGARQRFQTVVLDPPAFTKSRTNLQDAGRGYKEINLRALRLLEPGGILITCSCSHHFSEAMLLETVAAAALDAGRTLRVLERRTQSQDHPILLTVPETHYLKCLIFQAV